MARGQGAIQIVDEIKNSLNANDMISSIDERFNSIIGKYNYVKKYYGKVISVKSNQTKATVSISGQDTNMTFLNKAGEMLKVGDYVKIECAGEDMTSAFISERFGASNIENLNRLNSSLDTSSLVSALNSIFTFLNSQQKSLLATAITLKGVPTSASDSFAQMAYNILQIQSGSFYIEAVSAATVSFSWFVGVNVRYRIDTGNWIDYTSGTNISLSANQKLYFRGLNVVTNKEKHFVINGTVNVHGDITHLIHGKGGDQALVSAKCCSYMFYNCTGVRTAPNLPSTILSEACYSYMFYGCTSLIAAPALPATVLTESCYMNMFYNCSNLITVPELNAPVMTYACYAGMFYGCSKITQTPTLPSKSLALACYDNMFLRCTSLTTVTTLPADVLAESCYSYMFGGCTSLTTPPILKATKLANNCYMSMFKGCSKLVSKIGNVNNYTWRIPTTTITGNDPVLMMMQNTSLFSVTIAIPTVAYNYYLVNDVVPETKMLGFISRANGSTIRLSWVSGEEISYKTFNSNWTQYVKGTTLTLNENEQIIFSGKNIVTNSSNHFSMTGSFDSFGDITSLTNGVGGDIELLENSYYYMFYNCSALKSGPNLPSTTLSKQCYSNMFRGCTSLTKAPDIKGTTLAYRCCYEMFYGCTSLITPPSLPATTLAEDCYPAMFYGCTSLVTAPVLPATNLAAHCYDSMFQECSALKNPPELPATTMVACCYQDMFYGCASLTTPPSLPATTLAENCYLAMFYQCTGLKRAPVLRATSIATNCFNWIFYGCTSLSYIKLEYDGEINFYAWVNGVPRSGDIYYNGPTTTRGIHFIPFGWTVHSY